MLVITWCPCRQSTFVLWWRWVLHRLQALCILKLDCPKAWNSCSENRNSLERTQNRTNTPKMNPRASWRLFLRDIKNERNWFPFLQPRLIKINGRIKKPSLIKARLWCSHLPPVVVCPYPRGSGDNWASGKENGISLWSTSVPTTSPK